MPGPTVRQAEWQQALSAVSEAISGGGLLVGSGSLPPGVPNDFYARLAEIASGEDAKCIIDTSGEALRESLGEKPYLIKPNMRELKDIVGRSDLEDPEIRDAARELIEDGKAEHVVVSLGAGGAILVSEESVDKFQSPTVPIRSRIGAGDSMIGGIVHALSKGSSMREALQWGIAAGAAAVITPGTELCRREDVDRLYNEVVDRNG
jgi:6-phosphofructokinase 2